MTTENKQFFNLPQGKTSGFCQPTNSSVWKDGGTVVDIYKDCLFCTNRKCMMFEDKRDENGNTIGKVFTIHPPAWPDI